MFPSTYRCSLTIDALMALIINLILSPCILRFAFKCLCDIYFLYSLVIIIYFFTDEGCDLKHHRDPLMDVDHEQNHLVGDNPCGNVHTEGCFDHHGPFLKHGDPGHHQEEPEVISGCTGGHCMKVMVPTSKLQPHNFHQTVQNVLQNSKMAGVIDDGNMKVTAKVGASKKEKTPPSEMSLDLFSKKGKF